MKHKRFVVAALAAVAAALVFVVVSTASGHPKPGDHGRGHGHGHGGATIHVIEHATTDAVTNGSGDQAGNVLTFDNDVFDSADAKKVGSDQGYCVRIVVGKSWECNWTTFLPDGQITVEGPFSDTGKTVLAVTGGTGKYRNARGEMELKYHTPTGTEFDFVFHVIG